MAENLQFRMTKPGMMVYPNVIVPKAFGQNPKPDAKKSYSISFALDQDHPDVAPMKALILQAAKSKFPGLDIGAQVKDGKFKVPFTSGDKIAERRALKRKAAGKEADDKLDFLKGKIVFKASSDFPIALGVRTKDQGDVDVTDDNKSIHKEAFYTGCSGLGGFSYKPYDAINEDGKPGVKAYLDIVHSLNSGKRIQIGGKSAAETFKGVAGAAVDESVSGDELSDADGF